MKMSLDSVRLGLLEAVFVIAVIVMMIAVVIAVTGCSTSLPLIPDKPAWPPAVTNILPPIVTPPDDTATGLPFDAAKCTFSRIAKDVLTWKETRTLTVNKFTRDKFWSSCTGPDWPSLDGLQGCFGLAVEQPNGEIIVGTWDWNRSKHQPMKLLENLHDAEHSFFRLYSGARIWWFATVFSRDARRTVLERTQFVEARWP